MANAQASPTPTPTPAFAAPDRPCVSSVCRLGLVVVVRADWSTVVEVLNGGVDVAVWRVDIVRVDVVGTAVVVDELPLVMLK
jgi:hypothetical protein